MANACRANLSAWDATGRASVLQVRFRRTEQSAVLRPARPKSVTRKSYDAGSAPYCCPAKLRRCAPVDRRRLAQGFRLRLNPMRRISPRALHRPIAVIVSDDPFDRGQDFIHRRFVPAVRHIFSPCVNYRLLPSVTIGSISAFCAAVSTVRVDLVTESRCDDQSIQAPSTF